MNPVPSLRIRTPEAPGRVVATMRDVMPSPNPLPEPSGSFRSSAPIDAKVYDEWTAEAEAEALEALNAGRPAPRAVPPPQPAPEEVTLEPSADAPARGTSPGSWLLLAAIGAASVALLASAALAAAGALLAGVVQAF